MNQRTHNYPQFSNSFAIRQEIQRFESVHPSIYAIYDLIEVIPDPLIQQQIRDNVVCIEDSFVNSQEWTLSRMVPDLRLGILGAVNSGKSALVHRYLTGSYMQDESPEGGRFKKEVIVEGQSYLLMIRDEGGLPETQFSRWVDAVIFVFSLENEESFSVVHNYYRKMMTTRDLNEVPVILVGTQDAISESNPRVIDDARARRLASDMKKSTYYETCATYGLNVERVFQDACHKIVQQRLAGLTPNNSRPNTPNHSQSLRGYVPSVGQNTNVQKSCDSHSSSSTSGSLPTQNSNHMQNQSPPLKDKEKDMKRRGKSSEGRQDIHGHKMTSIPCQIPSVPPPPVTTIPDPPNRPLPAVPSQNTYDNRHQSQGPFETRQPLPIPSSGILHQIPVHQPKEKPVAPTEGKDLATPTSTPTQSRKNRRRSNIFTQKNKQDDKTNGTAIGSGRSIPLKQGILYKKSNKPLNKDWKKKYVALLDNGKLTYHPNMHDYMENIHGKEIQLVQTTVKIPGMKPRGSRAPATNPHQRLNDLNKPNSTDKELQIHAAKAGIQALREQQQSSDNVIRIPAQSAEPSVVIPNSCLPVSKRTENTPNVKKRHKRTKTGSGAHKNDDGADSDGYEFIIVSLDNRQWHFEASSAQEREEWVTAIEQQILSSLQLNESRKAKGRTNSTSDAESVLAIRSVRGNTKCADCDSPNPQWASLNLGAIICIECSGIHRNLGSHISRVRSLDLDDWPPELVNVMTSIGNAATNSVWEANIKGRTKPNPQSPREEKEKWIKSKYELKLFLPPLPYDDVPLGQQLMDGVARQNISLVILVLAYCAPEDVNAPYAPSDQRTALHISSALQNSVLVQLLLWYGANVQLEDHDGHNALYYAKSAKSEECITLLEAAGCSDNSHRRGSFSQTSPQVFDRLPATNIV